MHVGAGTKEKYQVHGEHRCSRRSSGERGIREGRQGILERWPLHNVVSCRILKSGVTKSLGIVLKEIEKLRRETEELQVIDTSSDLIRAKMYELDELLYREEMLWLQRSRVTWLKEGA